MHDSLMAKAKSQGFNPQHAADAFGLEVEDIVDIIDDYFTSAQRDVRVFKDVCRKESINEIAMMSHRMKGSAANLRLRHISSLTKEIENAANMNNTSYDYAESSTVLESLVEIANTQFKGLR